MGVGGNSTLGSLTAPSVLTYETSDSSGSRIRNISNATLSVYFKLRIPQAYKPGIGRPGLGVFSSNLRDYKGTKNLSATIENGEPNKGISYEGQFTMPPQASLRLVLQDVDFDRAMKQNLIDIYVTDDYYTQPMVVAPPPTRDVFEDGAPTLDAAPLAEFGPVHLSWFTTGTRSDPNGYYSRSTVLPGWVGLVTRVFGTFNHTFLVNNSDRQYYVVSNVQAATGGVTWANSGIAHNGSNGSGVFSMSACSFGPGEEVVHCIRNVDGNDLAPGAGTQVDLTFVPGSLSDRAG